MMRRNNPNPLAIFLKCLLLVVVFTDHQSFAVDMRGAKTYSLQHEDLDLIQAVRANKVEGVISALDKGANIDAVGGGGQTPLMLGVLTGQTECVKVLLEKGADVTIGEQDGYTPVHGAGFQGRSDVMKLLLKHGLDPLDRHQDGYTAIHRASWGKEERHTETVRVLLEEGGVPYDIKANNGKTPMEMTKNPATLALLAEKEAAAQQDKPDEL